jgi:hypothetical protein
MVSSPTCRSIGRTPPNVPPVAAHAGRLVPGLDRGIENGSFNVLKTKGYNLEHSFGHGKQNLAALLVTLNLLAFAFHTICDLAEDI